MVDVLGRAFDFKTRKRRAKELLAAKEMAREKKFKEKLAKVKEGKKEGSPVLKSLKGGV